MAVAAEQWVSPLALVERAVQERAKALAVDAGAAGAESRLRALIDDEIATWHVEFQRGRRSFDIADPAATAERALRNLAGYGPLQPLLDDPDVWEIMINGPEGTFV